MPNTEVRALTPEILVLLWLQWSCHPVLDRVHDTLRINVSKLKNGIFFFPY